MSLGFLAMNNNLHDDGLGSMGMSANTFAHRCGLPVGYVVGLCKRSKILHSRKHPFTKQWWIYPPIKIVTG